MSSSGDLLRTVIKVSLTIVELLEKIEKARQELAQSEERDVRLGKLLTSVSSNDAATTADEPEEHGTEEVGVGGVPVVLKDCFGKDLDKTNTETWDR